MRIARRVIVSFPNFGFWRIRLQILFSGRMPVTSGLPEAWYETPNIHFCTIHDFRALCDLIFGAPVERSFALSPYGHPLGMKVPPPLHNLAAQQAVFLLTREPGKGGRSPGMRSISNRSACKHGRGGRASFRQTARFSLAAGDWIGSQNIPEKQRFRSTPCILPSHFTPPLLHPIAHEEPLSLLASWPRSGVACLPC